MKEPGLARSLISLVASAKTHRLFPKMTRPVRLLSIFAVCLFHGGMDLSATTVDLVANATLSPVELDIGESVSFRLLNGKKRTFQVVEASAEVLFTNLERPKKSRPDGGSVYEMTCKILADGQPVTLRRYVCTQEAFYEPYVINGVRVWFDAVSDVENFLNLNHGRCKPNKRVRLVLQDATERICPDMLGEWAPLETEFIDIARTHGGDNCWMGAFLGADAHAGLDINHPAGTVHYAPFDLDDHYFFESLAKGHDNNRWRGIRRWDNGDIWMLQTHHVMSLLVPEHTKLSSGTPFCTSGGVKYGSHQHSHYMFKVIPAGSEQEIDLDPWIIYWQIFEDSRTRKNVIRARMNPLDPAQTGQAVSFDGSLSTPGMGKAGLTCFWTFGDGGTALGEKASHVFARPGVYAVTLTVGDGNRFASTTQHLSVNGSDLEKQVFVLKSSEETSFRPRPPDAMDVYGRSPSDLPHTMSFVARTKRLQPNVRHVRLANLGGGTLGEGSSDIRYMDGEGWLSIQISGEGNEQVAAVSVNAAGLPVGLYRALVSIKARDAENSPQLFWVSLLAPAHPAFPPISRRVQVPRQKVVDDGSPEFYATPWFWVGHRLHLLPKGYNGFSLMNGGRPRAGEFVRFTPDLEACRYEVKFAKDTPFDDGARFAVRVRHADGEDTVWVEPAKSRRIGTYDFEDGTDGFVEILAEGSTGQVIADAIVFERVEEVRGNPMTSASPSAGSE